MYSLFHVIGLSYGQPKSNRVVDGDFLPVADAL